MIQYQKYVFQHSLYRCASLLKRLGELVTGTMGDRDRKWISEQVMEIEVPDMLKTLEKGLKDLFDSGNTETPSGPSVQPG